MPKRTKFAPAAPADYHERRESFNQWWPKYVERVGESVTAAEQYLEIPAGTISSIPQDQDFIAVVKAYAVIEPMLNDIISARSQLPPFGSLVAALASPDSDDSFRSFVTGLNIGGRVGKVALAKSMGLLKNDQIKFIERVARVRNRYAHNVRNMHRSFVDVLNEEQISNVKIVEQVTGLQIKLPYPALAPLLKLFMYHRLADYLADALQTLKPPPFPAGLLSRFLESGGDGGDKGDEQPTPGNSSEPS